MVQKWIGMFHITDYVKKNLQKICGNYGKNSDYLLMLWNEIKKHP